MTAVIALPSVWVLIMKCVCCQQRGKNYKFQKLHYPLEQDNGLKKISEVQKINVQVCMFWQGPHLAKYASKEIYKIRKMVTFLFLPFLWPQWSVFARAIIGQRGTLPVTPLGYLNPKKVIFRTMRTMRKQFPVTWLTSGRFSAKARPGQ